MLGYSRSGNYSTLRYGIAPTVTYYFNPEQRLRPYISGTLGYIGEHSKYGTETIRNHSFVIGGGGGMAYF